MEGKGRGMERRNMERALSFYGSVEGEFRSAFLRHAHLLKSCYLKSKREEIKTGKERTHSFERS